MPRAEERTGCDSRTQIFEVGSVRVSPVAVGYYDGSRVYDFITFGICF